MTRQMAVIGIVLVSILSLLSSVPALAQTPTCAAKPTIRAVRIDSKDADPTKGLTVERLSQVELYADGLSELISCIGKQGEPHIALFLNHSALSGLKPVSIESTSGKVVFSVERTKPSHEVWLHFYRSRTDWLTDGSIPVTVGLGLSDGRELAVWKAPGTAQDAQVTLRLIHTGLLALWFVFAVALIAGVVVAAKVYGLLQDSTPTQSGRSTNPADAIGTHHAYSLGKTQLALWFVTIILSATFIGLVTGQLPVLGDQTLWLLGISAGTSVAAVAIDHVQHQLPGKRANFLFDILSDANGLTIPRVQILVVTLVLIGVFISSVVRDLTLPALDPTWTGIMGLGSLTYLGFKVPEKKTNTQPS